MIRKELDILNMETKEMMESALERHLEGGTI